MYCSNYYKMHLFHFMPSPWRAKAWLPVLYQDVEDRCERCPEYSKLKLGTALSWWYLESMKTGTNTLPIRHFDLHIFLSNTPCSTSVDIQPSSNHFSVAESLKYRQKIRQEMIGSSEKFFGKWWPFISHFNSPEILNIRLNPVFLSIWFFCLFCLVLSLPCWQWETTVFKWV